MPSRRGVPFKACRRCKSLVPRDATRCPVCGSTDLSEDWEGAIIVREPTLSLLSQRLELQRKGRFALRVR
ncbi:MAG: DNA-binding protein [Hyperthermus sp.]|nr:MAG: DNA-binding protein [Hyperthermus sp.]